MKALFAVTAIALLTACGSGGGDAPPHNLRGY